VPNVAAIPSRTGIAAVWRAVAALTRLLGAGFARRRKLRQDARALQAMPAYLLADLGLEKIEFRSSADGRRDVWVIPHS
jgi:uncharacterized protein YjiS (DUF1127 family)